MGDSKLIRERDTITTVTVTVQQETPYGSARHVPVTLHRDASSFTSLVEADSYQARLHAWLARRPLPGDKSLNGSSSELAADDAESRLVEVVDQLFAGDEVAARISARYNKPPDEDDLDPWGFLDRHEDVRHERVRERASA